MHAPTVRLRDNLQTSGAVAERIQPHVLRLLIRVTDLFFGLRFGGKALYLSVELNENVDTMAVNDDCLLVAVLTEKIHIPLRVMY